MRFKAIGHNASVEAICTRFNAGDIPTCPVCGNDLIVANGWQDARPFDAHPGIFCKTDPKHFRVLFNVEARGKDVNQK